MTVMTAMPGKRYEGPSFHKTWLRPEGADHPEQLVGTVEIGDIAEVSPNTVLMWAEKYDHFPQPVREVKAGRGVTRSYLVKEVVRWLLEYRPRLVRGLVEEERMAVKVVSYQEEINALQAEIDRKRAQRDALIEALQRSDTPENA